MSITTRQGDKGTTRLFSGEEVDKCSARPDTYGDLDELVSLLGLARLHIQGDETARQVLEIQRDLFLIGAEIATTPDSLDRLPKRLGPEHLDKLDGWRDAWEAQAEPFRGFIVPSGSVAAGFLDLARTVTRRLERKVVRLHRDGELDSDHLLIYLNRLSDYFWLIARTEEDEPIMLNG